MAKITEPVNLLETADMEEVKNLSTVNDAEPCLLYTSRCV